MSPLLGCGDCANQINSMLKVSIPSTRQSVHNDSLLPQSWAREVGATGTELEQNNHLVAIVFHKNLKVWIYIYMDNTIFQTPRIDTLLPS